MTQKIAIQHSLNAFLNSFYRDYAGEGLVAKSNGGFNIPLKNGHLLRAPIKIDSLLGNNAIEGKLYLAEKDGRESEIDHKEFLQKLVNNCFADIDQDGFLNTVLQSVDVMGELFEKSVNQSKLGLEELDYLGSEQFLTFGHPFHPYPKSFSGFGKEERGAYLPENARPINLIWIAVKNELVFAKTSRHFEEQWCLDLAKKDLENLSGSFAKEGFCPMPHHPWQWERLKERKDIANALCSGDILVLGSGKNNWYATSSTRSLYCPKLDWGLKFSLSVRITNSVRHLGENELIRGIQVDHVFHTKTLQTFLDKHKQFKVLREPACLGIKDADGNALVESFVLCRQGMGAVERKRTFLLSALTQAAPSGQSNLLAEHIKRHSLAKNLPYETCAKNWLDAYLQACIAPLLNLACDHGLLLGAHMQNVLVEMGEFLPEKILFRDCQGSGFTQEGFELFESECPLIKADNGNVLDLDSSKSIFLYYLVVNNIFGVVSALAKRNAPDELRLLSVVKKFLYRFGQSAPKNMELFEAIYSAKTIFQKGNFRCCVQGHNENTMVDPSSIYNEIENPIATRMRTPKKYEEGVLISRTLSCGSEISFRKFDMEAHLDTYHRWHNHPYVSEFWEMAQSKDELKEYVEGLLASPYQLPVIYEVAGQAAGYFEIYWSFDDRIAPYCSPEVFDRGIHLLIGEESFLRTKYVLESINLVSEFIFEDDPNTKRIWAEPRSDNTKIRKIGEKLPGWRFVREFDFPHKRAALLCNERESFYTELARWKR